MAWTICEEWMNTIRDTKRHHRDTKNVVLTHNGFYWADDEEATNPSNQIREEDYERVIKRGAEDIALLYEKTKRYAKKQTNSYGGKHFVEDKEGYYMTNGEFILAAICSGILTDFNVCDLMKGLQTSGPNRKMNLNVMLPMRLKEVSK